MHHIMRFHYDLREGEGEFLNWTNITYRLISYRLVGMIIYMIKILNQQLTMHVHLLLYEPTVLIKYIPKDITILRNNNFIIAVLKLKIRAPYVLQLSAQHYYYSFMEPLRGRALIFLYRWASNKII